MSLSQKISRLGRIPARCRNDARLVWMLENWREALAAEWNRTPLKRVKLRSGVELEGPDSVGLDFLFHETWVRGLYSPPGYEVGRGDVVIDVGANIGVFALYAATRAPGVRVLAYEPFPGNVKWLRRNVERSGLTNVEVRERAVGGRTGARVLHVSDDWIMHSLSGDGAAAPGGLEVECVSFDDLMRGEGVGRCDLLKLDCEGSEYEILEGCAPETLARVRRIVGEYHEGPGIGGTGRGLRRFLESRSFRVDRFEEMDVGNGVLCATNTSFAG